MVAIMDAQMKTSALLVAVLTFPVSHAFAADASGSGALALAAIVAESAPLPAAEKKTMASYLAGSLAHAAKKGTIKVSANSIRCRLSNVAIQEHSCTLEFGAKKRELKGRKAHELYATLAEIGIQEDGAAGSIFRGLSHLVCEIKPRDIADQGGGGASCKYSAGA
jgi:hypothetical protein